MTEVILMEIRAHGSEAEGGGWVAGFTAGLFYSDSAGLASGAMQKKDATGTTGRYYEMDISAHGPHPTGRNNTGQVTLRMRRSLSRDEDWNKLCVVCYDIWMIFFFFNSDQEKTPAAAQYCLTLTCGRRFNLHEKFFK